MASWDATRRHIMLSLGRHNYLMFVFCVARHMLFATVRCDALPGDEAEEAADQQYRDKVKAMKFKQILGTLPDPIKQLSDEAAPYAEACVP